MMAASASSPCRVLIALLVATHVDAYRVTTTLDDYADNTVLTDMSEDPSKYDGLSVGCYCKAIASMSQCEDNKYRSDPEKPTGPRFFHAGASSKAGSPHLCCKLGWVFSFKGWSYHRQKDLSLCMAETREVPSDSCCRLQDAYGSFGVRIGKAQSEGKFEKQWQSHLFSKSPPTFTLADIASAQDYNGAEVALEDVHEFVQTQLEAGRFRGKLQCGGDRGSFESLFAEKGACQLRTGPSQQCCCHVASLIEASRCLPAEGAADEAGAQRQVLESEYKEWSSHSKREGRLTEAPGPNIDRDLQAEIKGVVDPKMQDLPETAANETQMVWDWMKDPNQWRRTCAEKKRVPYVISESKSKRVQDGYRAVRMGKVTTMKPKYKTKRWTEYRQGYREKCAKVQWDRICGAGQGLYVKQINPGQCMKEPSVSTGDQALTDVGSLLFECPDDYSSGNGGMPKFNAKCECAGDGAGGHCK